MSYAPAPSPSDRSLHDHDLHAWSIEQARLLMARRFGDLDVDNLAEEILGVAKTEFRVLVSALRILLLHMLKWDYQPERRSRSWENSIAEHRQRVEEQLQHNPSLLPRSAEAVQSAYGRARLRASSQTDTDLAEFPVDCPYDWETIMHRVFRREPISAEKTPSRSPPPDR